MLPYGAPFEEIYAVMDDLLVEVKRLEAISKEAADKAKEEQEKKDSEESVIEASVA